MILRIVIKGKVISKDNEKIFNRQGKFFLSRRYKLWERNVAFQAKAQMIGKKPYQADLFVLFDFYFPDKRHVDLLNAPKSLADALNKIVWLDDRQIKQAVLRTFYDKKNPRVEIIVDSAIKI